MEETIKKLADNMIFVKIQPKRIDGDWAFRYVWERFNANGDSMYMSEWGGFEEVMDCVNDALGHVND